MSLSILYTNSELGRWLRSPLGSGAGASAKRGPSWQPQLSLRPLAFLSSFLSRSVSFRLWRAAVLILGVVFATLLLSGELLYIDALHQRLPNVSVVELGVAGRLAPLTLPLRNGAADFSVVYGSQVSPSLAHSVLSRALARDPWNLAYRTAIARLTAVPPAKGVHPGGTEVKP